MNEKINWTRVLPKTDTAVNDMLCTWIDLKKISRVLQHDRGHDRALADQLATMLPKIRHAEREAQYLDATRAFYIEEKLADGQKPSAIVCEKLLDYYNSYNGVDYLAPLYLNRGTLWNWQKLHGATACRFPWHLCCVHQFFSWILGLSWSIASGRQDSARLVKGFLGGILANLHQG